MTQRHIPVGTMVRILMPIGKYSIGPIESRNGEYYYVRLKNSVTVERYRNELTVIE